MTDPADTLDAFRLAIRSLDVASKRIQATYESDDIDAAAIEVHFGLHAAYDLLEVFFGEVHPLGRLERNEVIPRQDDVLLDLGGESLGALAAARGAHTHRMIGFAGNGGWPGTAQGMMPGVRGWVWVRHEWTSTTFATRGRWYSEKVAMRMLHTPIDGVSCWGTDRYWEYASAHGLKDWAMARRERADPNFI